MLNEMLDKKYYILWFHLYENSRKGKSRVTKRKHSEMRQQPDYKSAGQNFNEWWKCSVTLLFFGRYKSAQISQNS